MGMNSISGEEFLAVARKQAGVNKGRLLFKMKPLRDMKASLSENGIASDPRALHLMLPRKFRPAEVAQKAALEEHMIASHTAAAAAARGISDNPAPGSGPARDSGLVNSDINNPSEDGNESVRSY